MNERKIPDLPLLAISDLLAAIADGRIVPPRVVVKRPTRVWVEWADPFDRVRGALEMPDP